MDNTENEPVDYQIDEFSRHILLYSKYWYKRSEDQISDLKILCGKIAGMQVEDGSFEYTDDQIWKFCVQTFMHHCDNRYHIQEYLERMFHPFGELRPKDSATLRDSLDRLLGAIAHITVKDNKLLPKGIGKINTNYLPAREIEKY